MVTLKSQFMIRLTIVWAVLTLMPPQTVGAVDSNAIKITRVLGTSSISKDNVAQAREDAIANGLVIALERVATELIGPETAMKRFHRLNDVLYDKAPQFVRDFKVLTEHASKTRYRVLLEARIVSDLVAKTLGRAAVQAGAGDLPKLLVLAVEQRPGSAPSAVWQGGDRDLSQALVETALTEALKQKGYAVKSRSSDGTELVDMTIPAIPDFDPRAVVDLGRRLGVDIVVVGHAVATTPSTLKQGRDRSFTAMVTARTYRMDSGALFGSVAQKAEVDNPNKTAGVTAVLTAAGGMAGSAIAAHIETKWQTVKPVLESMELVVTGTRHLGNFVTFRRMLANLPQVDKMQVKGMKANEATIRIETQSGAGELSQAIKAHTFAAFEVEITEPRPGRLNINLISGE